MAGWCHRVVTLAVIVLALATALGVSLASATSVKGRAANQASRPLPPAPTAPGRTEPHGPSSPLPGRSQQVCGPTKPGRTHCDAVRFWITGQGQGYTPLDLQVAYDLPSSDPRGITTTVGIVDAYDDPNAEADMATYRAKFGLPACTAANGCFRKVNQTGGFIYPPPDTTWATETSLDLDMISATAPTATSSWWRRARAC